MLHYSRCVSLKVCIYINVNCFVIRKEAEIKKLEDEMAVIENGTMTEIPSDLVTAELEAMRTENAKLKYRINTLNRVCKTIDIRYWQLIL